jgi:hypothetical protein
MHRHADAVEDACVPPDAHNEDGRAHLGGGGGEGIVVVRGARGLGKRLNRREEGRRGGGDGKGGECERHLEEKQVS